MELQVISSSNDQSDMVKKQLENKRGTIPVVEHATPNEAKTSIWVALLLGAYFLWAYFGIGWRTDHLVLGGGLALLFFSTRRTRKFVLAFAFFWIYLVLYDSLRVFPSYLVNDVSIEPLYNLEKSLFGMGSGSERITFNEYFREHTLPVLDFLAGASYLMWVPMPLVFAVYLYYKNPESAVRFWLAWMVVNLLGFLGYYLYPAAPPWYVELHGFEFYVDTPSNAAGLLNFDKVIGSPVFLDMYGKSSNIFGAVPSLHSAYPLIVFYFAWRNKMKAVLPFVGLVALGIWFGAVYTRHHYTVDVVLGILCAALGLIIYEQVIIRQPWVRKQLNRLYAQIR